MPLRMRVTNAAASTSTASAASSRGVTRESTGSGPGESTGRPGGAALVVELNGCVESSGEGSERRRGLGPTQFVHRLEQPCVRPERRKVAKQEGAIAFLRERQRQGARVRGVHAPAPPVFGNRLEMAEASEHGGG